LITELKMPKLGVNIDHVATLREARRGINPQPVLAASLCEAAGADSIVVHLREDRRHIKEQDVYLLRQTVRTRLNLEMSISEEIVRIACRIKPDQATLVPEKRQELTTEGGLDIIKNFARVKKTIDKLNNAGIEVSLFIDPDIRQIDAAKKAGGHIIELHTGRFADAKTLRLRKKYLKEIRQAAVYAHKKGLIVNAGHGLDYNNVTDVARIKNINELNIGYSIICRSVMAGIAKSVSQMKKLIS